MIRILSLALSLALTLTCVPRGFAGDSDPMRQAKQAETQIRSALKDGRTGTMKNETGRSFDGNSDGSSVVLGYSGNNDRVNQYQGEQKGFRTNQVPNIYGAEEPKKADDPPPPPPDHKAVVGGAIGMLGFGILGLLLGAAIGGPIGALVGLFIGAALGALIGAGTGKFIGATMSAGSKK